MAKDRVAVSIEELRQTIAKVLNEWPREVRVPADLQRAPAIKSGELKLADVKTSCEWHDESPVKNPAPK